MNELIKVGMAQMKFCSGCDSITTLGLGSCIGIVIYEEQMKICGLAHIMLPKNFQREKIETASKFADTAVERLVEELVKQGASQGNLKAKIAGGAQMFAFQSDNEILQIGYRNIEATMTALDKAKIPLIASDTGENYGRTIVFCPETANMRIRAVGKKEKII